MTSIDPEARDALRRLARARTPDAAAVERAWAAMQVRLADGPAPLELGLDDARRGGLRPAVLALAGAALVVLAVAATRMVERWTPSYDRRDAGLTPYGQEPSDSERAVTPHDRADVTAPGTTARSPAAPPLLHEEPAATADGPEAIAPVQAPATPRTPRRSKSSTAVVEPAPSNSDLEAELRLLRQANAAMRAGRNAEALRVLDRHAREFPRGQLAPERDYKRARVTCDLGQVEAARDLARSFLRTYPRSPMRARAREICAEPGE